MCYVGWVAMNSVRKELNLLERLYKPIFQNRSSKFCKLTEYLSIADIQYQNPVYLSTKPSNKKSKLMLSMHTQRF